MRVIVTGREGQVVTALTRLARPGLEIVPLGRPLLDLATPETIDAALDAARPDIIVNAAAYTAVDKAEGERDLAFAVNAAGAGAVARAARRIGVPIIQISTDYVFSGEGDRPFAESDPTGPLGVYGQSKLEGERLVGMATDNHAILRTSWVHAPWGANFVRTMLRIGATRDEVRVVADQQGSPTSALDIAAAILAVATGLIEQPDAAALRGVFHMAASGYTTWAGFAEAIFAASAAAGGPSPRVVAIATADYPTPARRPANSRLACARLAEVHGVIMPDWREAVAPTVRALLSAAA